ncbi:DUF1398 family protein [Acidovorax sp. A1169]|uniref:DUF1398 family protein n=1 Tax=Acidovorax sp. A1169 TaxID=3059524 RepID=UPI002737EFE7|nr:DUF1398 family protein [Acidovorax sp. A1169]MDP4074416.1 DUF1398 family protein [Acidovorax sp. A1169]
MNETTIATIERCAQSSKDGTAHFGAIMQALTEAGAEAYFADYRSNATTYYLPGGETHTVALQKPATPITQGFDAAGVQVAIRGAQRGEVMYPEFLELSRAAGCVGYMVWLAGRHVSYFGRKGKVHVERFPDGK